MSAVWLPRGIGRIGFVALVLAVVLLALRWTVAEPPHRQASGVDPVIGRKLVLNATTPLPGRDVIAVSTRSAPHLVNLFASWCVPCRIEAPVLATVNARGIRIDGIAVRDEPAAVARFLNRTGDPFGSVQLDQLGHVQTMLGVTGLPETYVVDASGVITYRHRGALRPEDVTALIEHLR